MELKFKVHTKVQKPVQEVFTAVYEPAKLSGYFTTGGASGALEEGKTVIWEFADYPGKVPVTVKKVIPNELIAFEWPADNPDAVPNAAHSSAGYNTRVEMRFTALEDGSTLVEIREEGWKDTEKGLQASYGNCFGWTQMSCSLKAFAEYGINLRKGAF